MPKTKPDKVQTTIRLDASLEARLRQFVYGKKMANRKVSKDSEVAKAIEMHISGAGGEVREAGATFPRESTHPFSAIESRVLEAFRSGSLETKQRILAAAAKPDEPVDLSLELRVIDEKAEKKARWHAGVDYVLDSGVEKASSALMHSIEAFVFMAALARGEEAPFGESPAASDLPNLTGSIPRPAGAHERGAARPGVVRRKKR